MHAQTTENDFVSAFRHQLTWLLKTSERNLFVLFNPLRPIVFQYNKWRMDTFVGKALDQRFSSRHDERLIDDGLLKRSRPVIDLALDAYHQEEGPKHKTTGIDPVFKRFAIDQIKTFMFAGHDTTSSTICYVAYALSEHLDALRKVRQEYDEVFGPDIEQTPHLIKKDPYLINKLSYTVAVIKEILRLYPPASTVRKGLPGFFLQYDGKQYPTEGMYISPLTYMLQMLTVKQVSWSGSSLTLYNAPLIFGPRPIHSYLNDGSSKKVILFSPSRVHGVPSNSVQGIASGLSLL